MKYLIIGTILALVFVFIYSRLRPYIEFLRKMTGAMKGTLDATSPAPTRSIKNENKLVRCMACGTWIPAERALRLGSKLSEYCSRDCLENAAAGKTRKAAG